MSTPSNGPPLPAAPHSLLFLGSLLGLGCATDDPPDGATPSPGDATTVGRTTAPATSSGGGTTAASGGTTASADTTAGVEGSSSGSGGELMCDEPPPTGPIGVPCMSYTELRNLCNYGGGLSSECVAYFDGTCQYYLEEFETQYGPTCVTAWEDYYVCLSALPCEQVGPGACEAEEFAIGGACQ